MGLVVIVTVPGCGDGNGPSTDGVDRRAATAAISTIEEWCDVIDEVEALFDAADDSSAPFNTRQRTYRDIQLLFDELAGGAFVLDPDSRRAVLADLDFGNQIATAWAEASDDARANATLAGIMQGPLVAEGVAARIYACEDPELATARCGGRGCRPASMYQRCIDPASTGLCRPVRPVSGCQRIIPGG